MCAQAWPYCLFVCWMVAPHTCSSAQKQILSVMKTKFRQIRYSKSFLFSEHRQSQATLMGFCVLKVNYNLKLPFYSLSVGIEEVLQIEIYL